MKRKRLIVAVTLLLTITVTLLLYANIVAPRIKMVREEKEAFENIPKLMIENDIYRYNSWGKGEEFYALHSYNKDNKSGIIYISKGDITAINWEGEQLYTSGTLHRKDYNNFRDYINSNNVDSFDTYYEDTTDDRIEYGYLHCEKDGPSSFYFSVTGVSEDSKKYIDLINLFNEALKNRAPDV